MEAVYAKKLKTSSRGFFEKSKNFAFPPCCPVCAVTVHEVMELCLDCWDELKFFSEPCCGLCGAEVQGQQNAVCEACYNAAPSWDYGMATVAYFGGGRKIVLRLKSMQAENLARFVGMLMWRQNRERLEGVDCLVPIPLHPLKQVRRGFNQAAIMAHWLGEYAKIPVYEKALARSRYTKAQTKQKDFAARFANLESSMKLRDHARLQGKHILLVDDVLTSGASFEAATQTLREAKPASIGVLAFARAGENQDV